MVTYISDVAVQSGAYVHLTHGNEEKASALHVAEVPRTQLQVRNLGHLHRLVADGFGDLLIYLEEAPEDGVCAHVWPIDDFLEVRVQLGAPAIDLLVSLQLEVSLGWKFGQISVLGAHQFVQVGEMVVPLFEGPFAAP